MTSPLRARLISAAQAMVGLSGADLAARLCPAGIVGVAPEDVPAAVAHMSTCELAAAALLRSIFARDVPGPYWEGNAGTLLGRLVGGWPWKVAEKTGQGGALRKPTLDAPPQPGDAIWYAPAPPHGEHVDACVVEFETEMIPAGDEHEIVISAVAGGQPDGLGHYSAIALVARTLVWDGETWKDTATGRRVWCVVDADLMAALRGVRDAPTDDAAQEGDEPTIDVAPDSVDAVTLPTGAPFSGETP